MSGRFHWDDFNDDFYWSSRLDPGLSHQRDSDFCNSAWNGYRRHWMRPSRFEEPTSRLSGAFNSGRDAYQVSLDVHQFAPNELTVKTVDESVVVEGRHEEKEDKQGFISRHFKRRYVIPPGYDLDHVYSTLSSDGVLTVRAPRIVPERDEPTERIIPIQQTGPAHLTVKSMASGTLNGHPEGDEEEQQQPQRQ